MEDQLGKTWESKMAEKEIKTAIVCMGLNDWNRVSGYVMLQFQRDYLRG